MRFKIAAFILLFFLFVKSAISAEKLIFEQQIPDGCGSGILVNFVPNKTPISKCNFKKSCDAHDLCYSRCLSGGDLHGKRECTNEALRAERRQLCEINFFESLIVENDGRFVCRAYANIYSSATTYLGLSFFKGGVPNSGGVSQTQFKAELQSIYSSIEVLSRQEITNDIEFDFKIDGNVLVGGISK